MKTLWMVLEKWWNKNGTHTYRAELRVFSVNYKATISRNGTALINNAEDPAKLYSEREATKTVERHSMFEIDVTVLYNVEK